MAEISDDNLGYLLWCAIGYDRRLPDGRVPDHLWKLLSHDWQGKINDWSSRDTDALGAQVRPRDGED